LSFQQVVVNPFVTDRAFTEELPAGTVSSADIVQVHWHKSKFRLYIEL